MFLITFNGPPKIVIKAASKKAALAQLRKGMALKDYNNLVKDPSFEIRKLTLKLLDQVTPKEWTICEDVSF